MKVLECSSTPSTASSSNATYSSNAFRPQSSSFSQFVRELFAATPLGIFIAALKGRR